jgi:hypothetical protein
MNKTRYFVLRINGDLKRLAKIEDNALAYGYEGGSWVSMPDLLKIINDITDYDEISEDEANKIIGGNK